MSTEGLIGVFDVKDLPSTHPDVFSDQGGEAILATTTQGFLVYGPYVSGYPTKLLDVYFSIAIDNNSADDVRILTLDVHDSFRQKVLAHMDITRTQFPVAGAFSLFKLSFTPEEQAELEFRIYYHGYARVTADKIAVVEPEKLQLTNHADILALKLTPPDSITPIRPTGDEILSLSTFTPETVRQQQGLLHGGTFDQGTFTPSDRGGIEFQFALDIGKEYRIEIELEGNIANVTADGEHGGKVSLFEIKEDGGDYLLGLQRMHYDYHMGKGLFRSRMEPEFDDRPCSIITSSSLAGEYSMLDWEDEPHTIILEVISEHRFQLFIDQYTSNPSPHLPIEGIRQVRFMLGNRVGRISGQHAITRFKRLRVAYI